MTLQLNFQDESLVPKITEYLAQFRGLEIIQLKNGQKPRPKRTKAQQEFVDGLKQGLLEVELHLQGKIKLKTAHELIAEIWPT